ncbi:PRD domain-containing protein [Pontibacillus yanchengensis]|uniref:PRD domain-containing protein n=1 Tax=Pontibacillus yanchengensis TaxID=462910 RepID=A0A6I4ZZU3_9BACI|nr:BglG family transcription antiterminator [Pontibacillus yanchengensis]MYL33610.1 PRD domain-containing protein [Pontibacillus yanchengensis]
MNSIQTKILLFLLMHPNQYILVQELANEFDCSEKTIRNHMKQIENYIHTEAASIIRKPGYGVFLHIDNEEASRLYKELSESNPMQELDEESRKLHMAYKLLMEDKTLTIKGLSSTFFVSNKIIKRELDSIASWLEGFHLTLSSKQKIGLTIEGTEKDKRAALARLLAFQKDEEETNSLMMEKLFSRQEISIIRNALEKFQNKHQLFYADETVEGLILHILFTIKRIKLSKSIHLSKEELTNLQNKKEYQWTKEMLEELEKPFVIHFPEHEIAYLTLHILSGRLRYGSTASVSQEDDTHPLLHHVMDTLMMKLSSIFSINFHTDKDLKAGLETHLQTTLKRLDYGFDVPNPMLDDIKKMYPYLFDQLVFALEDIQETLPASIPEEEIAFLVLHFQASIERLSSQKQRKKNILIVCHMGMGMSQLLRTKIERQFPAVHVISAISKSDVTSYIKHNEVDCIVSTTSISVEKTPSIVVSPLLEEKDTERLQQFFRRPKETSEKRQEGSVLLQYTSPFLLFLHQEANHRYKIIEQLARTLQDKGYVQKEYIESCIQRERSASTNIGGLLAIPHGNPEYVNQSSIAIATLKEPIEWGTGKVKMVCLLGIRYNNQAEAKQLFEELSSWSESPAVIDSLTKEQDVMSFLSSLKNI